MAALRQEHAADQLSLGPTSQTPRHDIALPATRPGLDTVGCFAPVQEHEVLYIVQASASWARQPSISPRAKAIAVTACAMTAQKGHTLTGKPNRLYMLEVGKGRKVSDKPGHVHTACGSR